MSVIIARKSFLSVILMTASITLSVGSALAQTPTVPLAVPATGAAVPVGAAVPAPTIMVVDADRIMQQAKASQTIQTQLTSLQQAFQKEFSTKSTELESDQQELGRLQRTLPPDQFEEKRHTFVTKAENTQKEADARKQALARGASDAIDKVKRALVEVVGGIAQERHANLVLLRSQVILYDPVYDASDEAMKRLDQKLTSVTVVIPTASASAAPAKK